MRKIKVGFLGCGNIGGGTWKLLQDMQDDLARDYDIAFEVKKMLVRSLCEKRAEKVPEKLLTTDVNEILTDDEISLVCEFMGGEQPAASYMLSALNAGKSVVTANKMALSLHWKELHQAAIANNAGLFYEASVCGAIPVIRTINTAMTSSRITKICGIVNGTTNYILTQMRDSGLSYARALTQAQQLGLAEPDPTSDVEGHDAAYKLSILSALCFGGYTHPNSISCCGISKVDITDINIGAQLGYSLKLIAKAECREGKVFARVSPSFVHKENQLYHVNGSFNAVLMHGHASDDIFLYGRGAGAYPTASAITADMIAYAKGSAASRLKACGTEVCTDAADSCYYIRMPLNSMAECRMFASDHLGKNAFEMHRIKDGENEYDVLLTNELPRAQIDKFCKAVCDAMGIEAVVWPIEGTL